MQLPMPYKNDQRPIIIYCWAHLKRDIDKRAGGGISEDVKCKLRGALSFLHGEAESEQRFTNSLPLLKNFCHQHDAPHVMVHYLVQCSLSLGLGLDRKGTNAT